MSQAANRVVLIEPQALFIGYLIKTLEAGGLSVVGAARKMDEAEVALHGPDVVLLDLACSDPSDFMMLRHLRKRAPYARLIIFGGNSSPAWKANAWGLGANDLLIEHDGPAELVAAAKGPRLAA